MVKFIEAVLILIGMILGVGILGIPFSFVQAGFWVGVLELVILAGVVLLFHLLYGEIVLKTKSYHRMPGYMLIYLGKKGSFLAWVTAFFGISGTLLAYILVSSIFLNEIFAIFWHGSSEFLWALVMVGIGLLITSFPLKKEAAINGILTSILIVFVVFLVGFLLERVDAVNLEGINLENAIVPYGVLLFALSGGIVVPDVITVLGRNRKIARIAIVVGTLIPAILYFFFALVVVGVAGPLVSPDAILGLLPIMGENIVIFGSLIGFLAAFTSYIVMNISFQALLRLDFGMRKIYSWCLASAVPFILYLLGFQNFIIVIGAVGALAVGIDSALVLWAYHKIRKKEGARFSAFSYIWKFAIYVIIGGGVLYQVYKLF